MDKKKTIMISLLGGRPLPNVQAVLHLKPDLVYFVASKDSIGNSSNYEKALQAIPNPMRPSNPLRAVNPYSMRETQAACAELAAQHPDDDIVLTLASEPKMMTLGAYEFARQTHRVRLCNMTRIGLVWLRDEQLEKMEISLEDYFKVYGWQVEWSLARRRLNDLARYSELLSAIAGNIATACELFAAMRAEAQRANRAGAIHRKCIRRVGKAEHNLLQAIQKNQPELTHVRFTQQSIEWDCTDWADLNSFVLSGDWLEAYVLHEALRGTMFYECAWNIRDILWQEQGSRRDARQVDFVGIKEGQLVAASCKSNFKLERNFFEEIRARADQLGKSMCSPMLITAAERNSGSDLARWAEETEVVLVTREDLPHIGAILKKVIDGDVNAAPKHITIYPRM